MTATLWPHQEVAIGRALMHPGFMLAHEMGVGKSRTAIEVLDRTDRQRVLVLCPKSVVDVWPDQLAQWSGRPWVTWAGIVRSKTGRPLANPSVARRAEALIQYNTGAIRLNRPFLAVVNYEAAHQGAMAELLKGTDWDAVILDESHRIKLTSGKASRLAALVGQRCRKRGGRVLALTGTPMPHSPLDLFAQIRALDGGSRFGTNYHSFCRKYGVGDTIYAPGGRQITKYTDVRDDQRAEFYNLVRPIWHRVATDDVLDLPDGTDSYRTFTMSPKTRAAYDALQKDLIAELDGGVVTAANAMVLVTRLAQVTSGFGVDAVTGLRHWIDGDGGGKMALLRDVLEDLPQREPVVIFCRFHADLDAVHAAAATTGRRSGELSGRRRDALRGPRMRDDIDIAAVQIQAGGVGIDLTRARYAIYYSVAFAMADYLQSRARVRRQGQDRTVSYIHLLAADSIDYAVYGALRTREAIVDVVINHLNGSTA